MRYSAFQEDGYGVGLGQETLPNEVDESMMAATGDLEPGGGSATEEGSMISNLPLLFANGYPTSLEKITLSELERFVTFMVQCSLGHDTAEVISEPQWWPKEIKFSIPIVRPKKVNETYMSNLKKLVFRCYTYHRSEYLLRFCAYLAQYPRDKLEYVNNWDSTTSLYLKTTGKLLVTFRNENMNYDKKIEQPRRMLLALAKSKKNQPNSTKCLRRRSAKQAPSPAMVEPAMEDIYLCDNCDDEFVGLDKMKEHEKLCYRVEPRPPTPEYEEVPEVKQDQFMEYFKLKSTTTPATNHNRDTSNKTLPYDPISQTRTSSRIRGSINLTRCPTIPFSSPAGLALGKKSKMMTETIQQERLDRIERHLTAPPLSLAIKPKWLAKTYEFDRWSVTYKPKQQPADKTNNNTNNAGKIADEYVHQYNFHNYKRKPMIDIRSQLLYVACKPLYVKMIEQTEEELEELKFNPSRYRTPTPEVPRIRERSPSIEQDYDPLPGDESNPIIIDLDDDDDDFNYSHPARQPMPMELDRPAIPILPSINQQLSHCKSRSVAKVAPTRRAAERRPKSMPASAAAAPASKSIVVVDLISDEEDENCDPLQSGGSSAPVPVTEVIRVDPNLMCGSIVTSSKLLPTGKPWGKWYTSVNFDGRCGFLRKSTP
ncbi:uncharacterized protein LOC131664610 [Phymastichus coffea]|uniref:uncharacterized protein LOC131664610 n=1 Tax=Phymastichus coffea TaxID=108790 RepID=UPI00273BDF16|nr:uncharacterized protein LOC131664610 [Phymastichus coffea]XP_058791835.1 uncharacterized protein LOC131664610 [Phymastichus coffea]XP_058791836.1 uncharacterized protein LOC131664610 [Phymastichus coffea]XP_058791837.1 uncharacterized protein LOC131664610 [Phymastichus coffea]